jgi:hypothetical protein
MTQFDYIEGDLYVGQSNEDNEYFEGEGDAYRRVTFATDRFSLVFRVIGSGYFPLNDEHIVQGTRTVFYPHQNEVSTELRFDKPEVEDELFEENISITYTTIDGEIYIRSQNQLTYSQTYIIRNDEIYRVIDETRDEKPYDGDDFLDVNEVQQENVLVENIDDGITSPLSYATVRREIESDDLNGAIRVQDVDTPVEHIANFLDS